MRVRPPQGMTVSCVSLKTRMTVAVSLLVAVLLMGMAFLALSYFQGQFKETISRQQFALVTAMAAEIDAKIATVETGLSSIARRITPAVLADRRLARTFLDDRQYAGMTFDGGLFLFTPGGELIAAPSGQGSRSGDNCSLRRFAVSSVDHRAPRVSSPFFCPLNGHPVLFVTAPVFGPGGRVVAILAGSLDLLKDNFLGRLASVKIGENGYLYLFTTDRMLVVHPDRTRILKRDVPVGANRLFDRAIEGFEGTGETVTSRGLATLSSFKRLGATDWILAANYPRAEAYAPIREARRYLLIALVAAVLLSVAVVWGLMKYLTAPLLLFTSLVAEMAGEEKGETPIPIRSRDEIGTLAHVFNRLLAEKGKQRKLLRDQLQFLQVLIDTIPTPIFYKDAEGKYLGCNKAFETYLGMSRAELVGKSVYDIAPPRLAYIYHRADMELLRTPTVQVYESSVVYADGSVHDVVFSKAVFFDADGKAGGLVGTFLDITERRLVERALT